MKGSTGRDGRNERDGWLATPSNPAEAALRQALDQAAARDVDEVALRRVWARVADLPDQAPTMMAADAVLDAAGAEQAALADAPARRARWSWLVAASLAGATAALALMLVQTRSENTRVDTRAEKATAVADVSANANTGKWDAAEQGSSVVAPATVRTGVGEKLHLTLRGGTDVVVLSESALVLDDKDSPSVSEGEVQFHVPPQAPGHTFAVAVRDYRVVVVGTRFSVRTDRERTAVGVSEGVVEIWTDHRIARVQAGESWSAAVTPEAAAAAVVPAPSATKTVVTANRTRGISAKASRASRTLLALASPSTSVASASKGGATSSGSPAGSVVAAVAAAPAAPASSASVPAPAPATESGAPAMAAPAVAPAVVETPLAMQARAARAVGDSRRALGLYRTLAQRGGAAGENAEYEIARILRDGLHQPREALAAWRSYRTAHPRGLLRVETDISVIETLVALDDKSGALTEATDFVRRYPESERRMEIARLAGDLLREGGNCAGAVDAYDAALSGRVRRGMADGVTFHRAACVQRGDRAAGTAALKAYLQSFPSGLFRTDAQKLLAASGQSGPAALAPTP